MLNQIEEGAPRPRSATHARIALPHAPRVPQPPLTALHAVGPTRQPRFLEAVFVLLNSTILERDVQPAIRLVMDVLALRQPVALALPTMWLEEGPRVSVPLGLQL